jgi:flagellar basal-body rod modification protein FlgD
MAGINGVTAGQGTGDQVTRNDSGGSMGNDTFLKLLVAQMKYQDPLEPTDSSQMMSQLAQFSQVEGLNSLNRQITALGLSHDFSSAVSMIGKTVKWRDEAGEAHSGVVSGVQPDAKGAKLVVGAGQYVWTGQITEVT